MLLAVKTQVSNLYFFANMPEKKQQNLKSEADEKIFSYPMCAVFSASPCCFVNDIVFVSVGG